MFEVPFYGVTVTIETIKYTGQNFLSERVTPGWDSLGGGVGNQPMHRATHAGNLVVRSLTRSRRPRVSRDGTSDNYPTPRKWLTELNCVCVGRHLMFKENNPKRGK